MSAFSYTFAGMPRPKLIQSEKKIPAGTRLPPVFLRAVEELAIADQRTVSFVIEAAVREYVMKHAPEKIKPDGAKPPKKK